MSSRRETGPIVWVGLRGIGVEAGVFVDMESNRDSKGKVEVKWRWRGTVCEKGVHLCVLFVV